MFTQPGRGANRLLRAGGLVTHIHCRSVIVFVLGMTLFAGGRAGAQERGATGVTMGYPASVGIIWHATENVALRPAMTFTSASNDASSSTFDSTGVGVGVSGLFFLRKFDEIRTYGAPRFSYPHTSTTSASDVSIGSVSQTSTIETTSSAYSLAGYFGAQDNAGKWFPVFGELGFGSTHTKETSTPSGNFGFTPSE